MGIGPKANGLRERVGALRLEDLSVDELILAITKLQEDRTLARALAQQKKRESEKPKVKRIPKPKKHVKHCMHDVEGEEKCCKCEMFTCSKPKKARKKKDSGLSSETSVKAVPGKEVSNESIVTK